MLSITHRYTGSIIGETDIFNKNRYEYYCVSCDNVPLLFLINLQVTAFRLDGVVVRTIIDENKSYEMVLSSSFHSL